MTPVDLLFKYGKVYHVDLGDRGMVTEVPKNVVDLDERLGLDIFPGGGMELRLRTLSGISYETIIYQDITKTLLTLGYNIAK